MIKYVIVVLAVMMLILAIVAFVAINLYKKEHKDRLKIETDLVRAKAEVEYMQTLAEIKERINAEKKEKKDSLHTGSANDRFNAASAILRNDKNGS